VWLAAADSLPAAPIAVSPVDFETRGVGTDPDDACFWVDPDDPGDSLLFFTSKGSGVVDVFDADSGTPLYAIPGFGRANNCAVEGDLLITTDIGTDDVRVHRLPEFLPVATFAQEAIQPEGVDVLTGPTGEPLIYVTDSGDASVRVYALATLELVRSFSTGFGGGIESIAADDFHQRIYVARGEKESRKGIGWFTPEGALVREFGAEVFSSDAEGMAIYACGTGGYLVVADQRGTATEFEIFERVTLAHRGTFTLDDGRGDFTDRTDGIDILQTPLPGFPSGILAACDGCGSTLPEELDVVRWERIAAAMDLMVCPNGRPPTCGDGVVDGAVEECDGLERDACPGPCGADCTCSRGTQVTSTTIASTTSVTSTTATSSTSSTTATSATSSTTTTNALASTTTSAISATTTTTIVVPPVLRTIDVRVAAGADDAEESASGGVRLESTDLELVTDRGVLQTVGLRFVGVEIPPRAIILTAHVQFQVEDATAGDTALEIAGEAVDDAAAFTPNAGNIGSRSRTAAIVEWRPPPWRTIGAAAPNQRTPDLGAIVQEIVDRPGWASGNALGVIIAGTGSRIAESFDGAPAAAPLLHVEHIAAGRATTTSTTNPPLPTTTSTSTTTSPTTTSTTMPPTPITTTTTTISTPISSTSTSSTDTSSTTTSDTITSSTTTTTTSTLTVTTTTTSSTTTLPPLDPPRADVVADAFTQEETPDTNFNTDGLFADRVTPKRAYLRARVSGVAGRTVKQARLHLTVSTDPKGPGDHGGRLHRTSCDWTEDTITWRRQPAIDAAAIAEHPAAVTRAERVTFDLTGAIVGDGDLCLALTSPADDGVLYESRETENGPLVELILE
jgi:myo-inositol-hexaphosphate 3-phosphohydrolase